ncbi:hypothetical protein COV81_04080 [Candidatus Peregrinibacteria bacterium CG11_big_fil_rev_8_21_14_0_20_41_10]|nr:MAG: hypothetical protein COV81_04080 [Candidatus Peregrinibacteria bacterium CG11_big_fil_rev_8_21_14_0_20_41_10]PIZ72963.1 MAG: hypothetical protein COY06_06010 [Candidatus Peregrinibacteria bacterium CG_4_10_14_0_2_um_filter_41_8]PJC38343.1 MAG: hypothetical protein CO045_00795 [Candidatus Peregrinibacteria bacterium CG_4_9_14_0_2_um_filter_41_14]
MLHLTPGKNCWKTVDADRGAVLVDAEIYFANFVKAVKQAKKAIYVLGWDFDTRIKLIRGKNKSLSMAKLLRDAVKKNPELQIYILAWDFYSIFAWEREMLTKIKVGWLNLQNIHFYLDNDHPIAASHHQKVVVIDDQVAFSGGLDLCELRWDTHAHKVGDPLRITANRKKYEPHHDVQIMLEGEPARQLGNLARTRWKRFKRRDLIVPVVPKDNRFDDLDWQFGQTKVAIARTEPEYRGRHEVREVERLYIDMINEAKDYIYIENQYLSAKAVQKALISSLEKEQGPEVVVVLPGKSVGIFVVQAMDVLRDEMIIHLYAADKYKRLGMYFALADDEKTNIIIHSKVMIVDDCLLRIGSSNKASRSMALDTECDILVDGRDRQTMAEYINWYYRWSIAHLLGVDVSVVPTKDMNAFIRGKQFGKHLREFKVGEVAAYYFSLDEAEFLDLERPLSIDKYIDKFAIELVKMRNDVWRMGWLIGGIMIGGIIFGFGGAYLISPIAIILIFALAGVLMVPLNFLVLASATIFGSMDAYLYLILGALISSIATYVIGFVLGRKVVSKLLSSTFRKVAYLLEQGGLFSVLVTRIVPVAPFAFVNLVAGAFKINVKTFLAGTLFGILPGTAVLYLFQSSLMVALRNPSFGNISWFASTVVLLVLAIFFLKRRLAKSK